MDITDAVNVMTWSATPSDPSAVWDIFSADSSEALRQFIRSEYGYAYNQDPIHSQNFYLTSEVIEHFINETNARHWRVEQRVGDAIFIPAGCAHQVRKPEPSDNRYE